MSVIPILGLVHRINISRLLETDDGAGGIKTTSTSVLTNLQCRISPLSQKDAQEGYGLNSSQNFLIIAAGNRDVKDSDVISLSSNIPGPIPFNQKYRVLDTKKQTDHTGIIHHTSFVVEKEDKDV